MRRLVTTLLLGAAVSCGGRVSAEEPPPPPPENRMKEYRIGENGVTTIGRFRVALAKTWVEEREGKKVQGAWLAIVEKGSDAGQKDEDVFVGDTVKLGDATFKVTEVRVAEGETSGSVTLLQQ